mmetsp:Transcript_35191/g.82857  ORF Transcript_35191/g.82857 Transcript_35191/m.82857 type:complete len:201 (-) Transcript_35191:817-1419(-)
MLTTAWLSVVVVKESVFLVGITVLRSISLVNTPPSVSMPSVSGVTSSRSRSCVSCPPSPDRIPPCTAAPYATASSGLMPLLSSLPSKNSWSNSWILGMRVEPPTSTTWSIWLRSSPESVRTFLTGVMVLLKRSTQSSSNLALVRMIDKSLPSWKASISTRCWWLVDSCLFALSTSRRSFWRAFLSLVASSPVFFLNSLSM